MGVLEKVNFVTDTKIRTLQDLKSPPSVSPMFPRISKCDVKRWRHRRTKWLPEHPELVKDSPSRTSQHISMSLPPSWTKISPAAQMVEEEVHRLSQGRRIPVRFESLE